MKEKVIGVRLTNEEYELLEAWRCQLRLEDMASHTKTMSAFIASLLKHDIDALRAIREREQKKAVAKRKRELKKAQNDAI